MLFPFFTDLFSLLIVFPGLLASITIHEFAHAWVADKLGDPTPRYQGRVSLDPRRHLDPYGTISMLLIGFGWGRPVEFDPYNLQNPKRDTALIAIAGPISNFIIAFLLAGLLRSDLLTQPWLVGGVFVTLSINISLAIFNLVPVHPLDGSKILMSLLPRSTSLEYELFMHRYGTMVLIGLLLPLINGTSAVTLLISPLIALIVNALVS